ncbi:MAG: outer membrane protein assembly factor BamB [Gammaproteobacteria bacterium]|nr:outer membrane protein assembly factor BamB [Gammaproteobacteria bacterium]
MKSCSMLSRPLLLLLCLGIAGCETMGKWFGDKSTAIPPAELVDFEPELKPRTYWSGSIGSGADKNFVRLIPAAVDGIVYAASRDAEVAAFDLSSGKRHWNRGVKQAEITGAIAAGAGSIVVGTAGGEVIALDRDDGTERWRVPVGSEVLAPAVIGERIAVVRSGDGHVFGLDLASGSRLWSYDRPVPALSLHGTSAPVLASGRVIVGFDGGHLVALDAGNGKLLWEARIAIPKGRTDLDRMIDIDAAPVVSGDTIYVASYQGQVAAVALDSGEILWTREISTSVGVAIDERRVYVTEQTGHVWALDRETGASLWKQDALTARQVSQPAVLGGYVVVADLEGFLHWLAADDGRFVARSRVGDDRIIAPPQVFGERVVVYGSTGRIAALGLP